MSFDRPRTFGDLCAFYNKEYRPLYDRFFSAGASAQELHTEVAAGIDHLFSRMSPDGEVPPDEIDKAAAHFKRATFDAFKITYENEIRKPYDRLMDRRYAEVHDGKFRGEITVLRNEARQIAQKARKNETLSRKTDSTKWGAAFDEWKKILPFADEFARLEASPEVVRAVKKSRMDRVLAVLFWLGTVLVSAFAGAFASRWVSSLNI